MTELTKVPVFAVVGHPNEGKSTVLSTLAEDDRVRVSPFPGETSECRSFPVIIDGKEILRFVDTPGFQYPIATLEWFQRHEENERNLANAFRVGHSKSQEFRSECELLGALADGAGVIYVADGSRPVESEDRVEMEILRLAGNPRMAVINSKEDLPDFVEEWKNTACRYFNSIRFFNAHRATYSDRIGLLESLKSIDQRWEPALETAIVAFREDWRRRNSKVIEALVALMEACVTHSGSARWKETQDEGECRRIAEENYFREIRRLEETFRNTVKRIYKHNLFNYEIPGDSLVQEDLLSKKTLRLLGLSRGQIAGVGAVSGGLFGGFLDAHAGGTSLMLGTLIGAGIGGSLGYFSSNRLTEVKVATVSLGWKEIVVSSHKYSNLPFILLDRALLYYSLATNWAHGRRESPVESDVVENGKRVGYTSRWESKRRKVCQRFFESVRKGSLRKREDSRRQLVEMLGKALEECSSKRPSPQSD